MKLTFKQTEKEVFELKSKLIDSIKQRKISSQNFKKIKSAIKLLFDKQMHQVRPDGEIYAAHPLKVTINLLNTLKRNDTDLIMAAILHDIIEDTNIDENYIKKHFGNKVLSIIKKLTNPKIPTKDPVKIRIIYQKHVLKQIDNEEVFLVKLHDLETNALALKNIKDLTIRKWLAKKYLPVVKAFSKKAFELSDKYWDIDRKFARGLLAKAKKYERAIPTIKDYARINLSQ